MESLAADRDVADHEAARRIRPRRHGLPGLVISIPIGRESVETDAEPAERPLVAEHAHQGRVPVKDTEAHRPAAGCRDETNMRGLRDRFAGRGGQGNSRAHHDGES